MINGYHCYQFSFADNDFRGDKRRNGVYDQCRRTTARLNPLIISDILVSKSRTKMILYK